MNRKYIERTVTVIVILLTCAYRAAAQPGEVKKVAESVFTLTTFGKDGNILASSHGVFVGNEGEAVSNLKPFLGAARAVAIDSKGNRHEVTRMLGVNDLYDVAKFKVEGSTKPAPTTSAQMAAGQQLWLVPYGNKAKGAVCTPIKSVEKFMDKYSYYIFQFDAPDNTEACPFADGSGKIAGIMQRSTTNSDIYATDINYIMSLSVSGLSVNDDTFRKIGIPAALPQDKQQALLAMMLLGQSNDSLKYASVTNDFIAAYPTLVDGYAAKAQAEVNANRFDEARECYETALKKVDAKDDVHYNYAKLIFYKETYKPNDTYSEWSMDKALEEAGKAYAAKPLPIYKNLEGQILFGKAEYGKAYDVFMELTKSSLKNADLYYNAALCKEQLKAPDTEIIALLDSAVNNTDSLNIREAAKYFLLRADTYNRMKNYRQAVFDYTRYEVISGRNTNANFYYVREQAEVNAKLFKQALSDIDTAIYLAPKEATFLAEKASLQLRLNMFGEAAASARKCIETAPGFSDAYLVLGLAQIKTGNKTEGKANLNKAKEMGNPQAQALIDKYAK